MSTTSPTYRLFREAMIAQKQVVCRYQGYVRELCPIIIGHTKGEERLLAYQFGGGSSSGLPPAALGNAFASRKCAIPSCATVLGAQAARTNSRSDASRRLISISTSISARGAEAAASEAAVTSNPRQ